MLDINNKIGPISISGLSDVGKTHILMSTLENTKRPICIITYNEMQAKKLIQDLKFFASEANRDKIIYFPKKEISPYDYISQSKDLPYERMCALNKIYAGDNFQTILIDDPIQCMDDINMISFVELLRREFGQAQIILSTHEDTFSNYICYKFQKYGLSQQTITLKNS